MFKSLTKDRAPYKLTIQGSISKDATSDVSAVLFQNYDDDSHVTYNLAQIGARDHYGDASNDGYGDLVFSTAEGANALAERVRITHGGRVGVGTSNPDCELDVAGTLSADTIVTRSLAVSGGGIGIVVSGANGTQGSIANLEAIYAPTVVATDRLVQPEEVVSDVRLRVACSSPDAFYRVVGYDHTNGAPLDSLALTAYGDAVGEYVVRLYDVGRNASLGQSTFSDLEPVARSVPVVPDASPGALEVQCKSVSTPRVVTFDRIAVRFGVSNV